MGFELISVVPVYHEINTPHTILFENGITPDMFRKGTNSSTKKRGDLTEKQKASLLDSKQKIERQELDKLKKEQKRLIVSRYFRKCIGYDNKRMAEENKRLKVSDVLIDAFTQIMLKFDQVLPWDKLGLNDEVIEEMNDNHTVIPNDNNSEDEDDLVSNEEYELTAEEQRLEEEATEDIVIAHVNDETQDADEATSRENDFLLIDDAHDEDDIQTVVDEYVQTHTPRHSHGTRANSRII